MLSLIVSGVALVLAGYTLGAIPVGYLVARWKRGIDIRRYGSGSTGTTNVLRVLGWKWSALVFVADLAKSVLPVLVARVLTGDAWIESATGVAVIVGHCWSIFGGWSGGKGSTSSFAALLVIQPLAALGSFVVAATVMAVTRYASLGSLFGTTFGMIFMLVLLFDHAVPVGDIVFIVGSPLIVYLRHRENVQRLFAGAERRIGEASGSGGASASRRRPPLAPESRP